MAHDSPVNLEADGLRKRLHREIDVYRKLKPRVIPGDVMTALIYALVDEGLKCQPPEKVKVDLTNAIAEVIEDVVREHKKRAN